MYHNYQESPEAGLWTTETTVEPILVKPKIKQYKISKICRDHHNFNRIVTLTNVDNPFDYITKEVPDYSFSRKEFKKGRIIEIEVEEDE